MALFLHYSRETWLNNNRYSLAEAYKRAFNLSQLKRNKGWLIYLGWSIKKGGWYYLGQSVEKGTWYISAQPYTRGSMHFRPTPLKGHPGDWRVCWRWVSALDVAGVVTAPCWLSNVLVLTLRWPSNWPRDSWSRSRTSGVMASHELNDEWQVTWVRAQHKSIHRSPVLEPVGLVNMRGHHLDPNGSKRV